MYIYAYNEVHNIMYCLVVKLSCNKFIFIYLKIYVYLNNKYII